MASTRKIQANRANARASTGPNTARGRARTARNALRHALSVPVFSDPVLFEAVDPLARKIAGPGADAKIQELDYYVLGSVDEIRCGFFLPADNERHAAQQDPVALPVAGPLKTDKVASDGKSI